MKKTISLCVIILMTNLTFAQNVDESGVIINTNPVANKQIFKTEKNIIKSNPVNILHQIPSPSTSTGEIAFDGENLWVASPSDDNVYKISPVDGALLQTIPVDSDPRGLTFNNNALWVADRSNRLLQKIDASNGNILQQFNLVNNNAAGLAWDKSSLWHVNNEQGTTIGDSIYNLSSSTGDIITSKIPFGSQPAGLAFDGSYLWQSDNDDDVIYKIDPSTFTAVDTLTAPGGEFPNGLAFDGQYLWVSNNDTDSLYQIDIEFMPTSLSDVTSSTNQIIVYPNPSSGIFTFTKALNANSRNYFVNIYNHNGQMILQKPFGDNNSIVINLDDFSSNLYFYTLSNKYDIIESGKLIIE